MEISNEELKDLTEKLGRISTGKTRTVNIQEIVKIIKELEIAITISDETLNEKT